VRSGDVDDADDDGSLARPLLASGGRVDHPAVVTNPAQARAPRVPLTDSVRGDQAEGPARTQQVECAAEEMSHKIAVAVRLLVNHQKPIEIGRSRRA